MIKIRFKKCCDSCLSLKPYTDTEKMYSDKEVIQIFTTIGCEHEKICKAYLEDYSNRKRCLNCKFDEVDCTNPNPCFFDGEGNLTGYTPKIKI